MSKRRACSRMATNFIFAKYREAKSNFTQKFAKISVGNFVNFARQSQENWEFNLKKSVRIGEVSFGNVRKSNFSKHSPNCTVKFGQIGNILCQIVQVISCKIGNILRQILQVISCQIGSIIREIVQVFSCQNDNIICQIVQVISSQINFATIVQVISCQNRNR
jgi:hypothetical protein